MTGFLAVAAAGGAFGAVVAFGAAIALRDRGVEVTGEVNGVHTAGRTSEVTVTFPDGRGRMVVADVGNYLFGPEPQIGDRPRLIYDPADPEWNVADEAGPRLQRRLVLQRGRGGRGRPHRPDMDGQDRLELVALSRRGCGPPRGCAHESLPASRKSLRRATTPTGTPAPTPLRFPA